MRNSAQRGFAMVEVVMATAIVGGLTVAALSLAGSSASHKINVANTARGRMLCRSLAEEISTIPVANWSDGGLDISVKLDAFVIEGEDVKAKTVLSKAGIRSSFTTIDSFDNYSQSPPVNDAGDAISGYAGWTRTVNVEIVSFTSPDTVSASETGLRKITVEAVYAGKTIASTTFLRSSEWERVQP